MNRRWLGLMMCVVALVGAACGAAPEGSSAPAGMTGAKVNDAVNNSTMKNGHFTVNGFLVSGQNRYAYAGEGDYQLKPVEALQLSATIQTYTSLGTITIKSISIGGRSYTKLGAAPWTSQPDTSTIPQNTPTDYIGEETRAGVKVWHIEQVADGNIGDEWVRESDGYVVYITFTGATGDDYQILFTTYNQSPTISAP